MDTNPAPSPREPQETAQAARELIELLEVLWERGRDMVSSTPVSASQLRVLYSLDREEASTSAPWENCSVRRRPR